MTANVRLQRVHEILHQELCQHILCPKADELIAAARKYDLDVETLCVRALVHELATVLQETGYVPAEGGDFGSDAPESCPAGAILN